MAPSAFHLPPPVLTTHEGIPYFAVHKSQLHGSPIHGVFRLDLPEQGALTLPAIPKDIFHVTVNSSQLRTTPTVPDWTYVPIHILKSRKSSTCFLLLSDLMCPDLAVIDRSDQPSGHTAAARTRVKTRIQKRRTDIVRVSDFDSAGWPISSLYFFFMSSARTAVKRTRSVVAWGRASVAQRRALLPYVAVVQERTVQVRLPMRCGPLFQATPSSRNLILMVSYSLSDFESSVTLIYITNSRPGLSVRTAGIDHDTGAHEFMAKPATPDAARPLCTTSDGHGDREHLLHPSVRLYSPWI